MGFEREGSQIYRWRTDKKYRWRSTADKGTGGRVDFSSEKCRSRDPVAPRPPGSDTAAISKTSGLLRIVCVTFRRVADIVDGIVEPVDSGSDL